MRFYKYDTTEMFSKIEENKQIKNLFCEKK